VRICIFLYFAFRATGSQFVFFGVLFLFAARFFIFFKLVSGVAYGDMRAPATGREQSFLLFSSLKPCRCFGNVGVGGEAIGVGEEFFTLRIAPPNIDPREESRDFGDDFNNSLLVFVTASIAASSRDIVGVFVAAVLGVSSGLRFVSKKRLALLVVIVVVEGGGVCVAHFFFIRRF